MENSPHQHKYVRTGLVSYTCPLQYEEKCECGDIRHVEGEGIKMIKDDTDPYADVEYRWGNRNILTVSEIQKAGFEYVTHPAFCYHPETKKQYDGSDRVPALTYTYLLGEAEEWDTRPIKPEVKQQAIDKMKQLGIYWVHQVYFGEIFIPEGKSKERKFHMFCRGKIKV